jgi:putative chitinase
VAGLPVLVAAMVTGQAAPSAVTHVVRRGDTVSGIAQQYGTDTATITRGNRLADPDRLRVGQRLAVPDRPGRAARTGGGGGGGGYRPAAVTYTVRAGDTVSDIARRTGLRVAAVLRANGLDAAAVVRPGQRMLLDVLRVG